MNLHPVTRLASELGRMHQKYHRTVHKYIFTVHIYTAYNIDIVTPKEDPQVFKIKLAEVSHLSMSIYSRGNNEEYLTHIVAVFRVIEQKGLPKKCQVLAKAVARWSKALKNLQEATES